MELLRSPRRFWLVVLAWIGISTAGYGVVLWGPTLISLLLSRTPAEAAALFGGVGLAAMAGRVFFSILPQMIGRRISGGLMGFGAAAALAVAALYADSTVFGYSVFVAMLIVAAFFYDGGCANLAPYAAELYPVRLAARAAGLAAASNGVGRIVGPLCLAVLAGTDQYIAPQATISAVTPAFLLLAGCALVVGLAFTFLGIETHRRPLALH
jgi:MFS transporter, putative metabolite:H+ symporter